MAATFEFMEDTGAGSGTPMKGATRTAAVTDVNWKNSGVQTDAYSAYPITAGNNSFPKAQFGHFSGTFNNLLAGLFAHITTAFGTGLTLKGVAACTTVGGPWNYPTTPSAATDTALTTDMTTAVAIGSGVAVWFGATGPEAANKAATVAHGGVDQYTNWLTTQLQTTTSAVPGDTAQVTLELEYQEN